MGRQFNVKLEGSVYRCKYCLTHLAVAAEIISKGFFGKYGNAYLLEKMVNVFGGDKEERTLGTEGLHTVFDVFCVGCGANVGWKHVSTRDITKMYKDGKFLLERLKVVGPGENPIPFPIQDPNPNPTGNMIPIPNPVLNPEQYPVPVVHPNPNQQDVEMEEIVEEEEADDEADME